MLCVVGCTVIIRTWICSACAQNVGCSCNLQCAVFWCCFAFLLYIAGVLFYCAQSDSSSCGVCCCCFLLRLCSSLLGGKCDVCSRLSLAYGRCWVWRSSWHSPAPVSPVATWAKQKVWFIIGSCEFDSRLPFDNRLLRTEQAGAYSFHTSHAGFVPLGAGTICELASFGVATFCDYLRTCATKTCVKMCNAVIICVKMSL